MEKQVDSMHRQLRASMELQHSFAKNLRALRSLARKEQQEAMTLQRSITQELQQLRVMMQAQHAAKQVVADSLHPTLKASVPLETQEKWVTPIDDLPVLPVTVLRSPYFLTSGRSIDAVPPLIRPLEDLLL